MQAVTGAFKEIFPWLIIICFLSSFVTKRLATIVATAAVFNILTVVSCVLLLLGRILHTGDSEIPNKQTLTEMDRNRQTQTQIDKRGQKWAKADNKTDKNRQKHTDIFQIGKKQTETYKKTDRYRQKQTQTDGNRK